MAAVLIGVPVFEGRDMVERALDSIREQTFDDYRVLVSVDGNDKRSYKACRPYAKDPRFEIVLQPQRLGWPGNLNWLRRTLPEPFFCYLQQDNYYAPTFLEALIDHAQAHPEAACVYSERVELKGRVERTVRYPEIRGTMQERVLRQMAINRSVPQLGVMRREAVLAAGLRWPEHVGAKSDSAWVLRLAREGELHFVDQPLEVKTVHAESVSRKWRLLPRETWRDVTILWGLNVLEGARPAFPASELADLITAIADHMIHGWDVWQKRPSYYDAFQDGPDGPFRLIDDFLREARRRYGIAPFQEHDAPSEPTSPLADYTAGERAKATKALVAQVVEADPAFFAPLKA